MDLIESYKEELKLIRKPWTKVWVSCLVLGILLLPWFAPEHITHMGIIIFIYSIGALGQNLLIGYTGQISFGQNGLLAIGAFGFGHLISHSVPWPVALFLCGLIAGLFGLAVGFPSLRLKGPYLAIATMGFGVAVYQVFINSETLSGGRMGLAIKKLSPILGLSQTNFNYYFNLIVASIFLLLTYNIVSSYMGRAFVAIRDNDIAAEVTGVNLTRYKLLSFFLSSFYTGIQGGLFALFMGHVEPNMFTFMESITLFVAVIIGGLASVEGAILGAAFIVIIPQLLSGYKGMVPVVYGLTIMLILIFEPYGLYGRWMKMRLYFRNWPFR